jgi:hypothetical protein
MPSGVNQNGYGQAWGPWGAPAGSQQWNQPGNQPQGNPGYGYTPWAGPPFWHPAGMSRGVGIAFMVLGFIFWWPVGLAMLFYMIGTGRMGCFGRRQRAMYQPQNGQGASPFEAWKAWASGNTNNSRGTASSGNHAFDEYKTETLRRLEEEQQEFGAFLERLRFAKDKAEFDQFMADRRNHPPAPSPEQNAA